MNEDSTHPTPDPADVDSMSAEDAERFVRAYVQRGGQGWSTFVDPSFFVGAAAASMAAGVTWDVFKLTVGKSLRALRHIGEATESPLPPGAPEFDDTLDSTPFENAVREAWESATRVQSDSGDLQHSIDEAVIVQWTTFMLQLQAEGRFLRLPHQLRQRLHEEAEQQATTVEALVTELLVAHVERPDPAWTLVSSDELDAVLGESEDARLTQLRNMLALYGQRVYAWRGTPRSLAVHLSTDPLLLPSEDRGNFITDLVATARPLGCDWVDVMIGDAILSVSFGDLDEGGDSGAGGAADDGDV